MNNQSKFHKQARAIKVCYSKARMSEAEQKFQNKALLQAYREILKGILGREPLEEEVSGHIKICVKGRGQK